MGLPLRRNLLAAVNMGPRKVRETQVRGPYSPAEVTPTQLPLSSLVRKAFRI